MATATYNTSAVTTNVGWDHPKYMVIELSSTPDVAAVQSEISWVLKAASASNAANYVTFHNIKLEINGVPVYAGTGDYRANQTIASGKLVVAHNDDGTKSVPVSAEVNILYSESNKSSYSGMFKLDDILRGIILLDTGSGYENYLIDIDNGTMWEQCIPETDNGSAWEICT